jgi:chemotaxis protein MotA
MKRKLDKATPLGFLIALGCIGGSIVMEHGNLGSYINVSAGMIVFGGTFGIAFIAFPMSVVKRMPGLIRLAFKEPAADARQIVQQFVHLAGRARKEGLLALEQEVAAIEYPLLKKGISLVVDGTDPEVVKQVLEIDVMAREARHETGIGLFEGLGGYAPTLGIVGTVLGLVRILGNMSNAAELGPSIAVAFIATLYGIGSANIVWLPLASKLKRQSALEAEIDALVIDGVEAIQNGDNPRIVEDKLVGYLSPGKAKSKKAAVEAAPAAVQAGAAAGAPSKAGA